MLYPFRAIGEDRVSLSPLSAPPAACMLELVRGLNELFDETPAILHLPGSSVLTLLYQNTVYQWQDLLDTIGPAAAALSQVLPLRFFGTTEARASRRSGKLLKPLKIWRSWLLQFPTVPPVARWTAGTEHCSNPVICWFPQREVSLPTSPGNRLSRPCTVFLL